MRDARLVNAASPGRVARGGRQAVQAFAQPGQPLPGGVLARQAAPCSCGGACPRCRGAAGAMTQASQIVQRMPATIMREESCEERCERNFRESSGEPMNRIAQRGYCLQQCRPPEREPEPERKPEPEPDPEPQPAPCKPGDTPVACEAPSGTPVQPAKVSEAIIGRWMGKFVKVDGDPGEGCIEKPYVAAAGEKVCTIGYGIQLPNCPVVSKATGGEPTQQERFPKPPKTDEEKKKFKPGIQNLRCNCPDQKPVDCKGPEAENLLRSRSVNGEKEVHDKVPVSLDPAQFDALVDLVMHHGSMPADLLTAIKTWWCTDAGKDHVRQLYLKSMLNPQGSNKPSQGFIDRRRRRVWPPACKP
jgi:GH24 family phage-related lysozyme (muramidase)